MLRNYYVIFLPLGTACSYSSGSILLDDDPWYRLSRADLNLYQVIYAKGYKFVFMGLVHWIYRGSGVRQTA